MDGGYFEGRYDNKFLFTSLIFSCTGSDSATYLGTANDAYGTSSVNIRTSEAIYLSEVNIGYKPLNYDAFSLACYGGFGYRYWVRGNNNSSTGDYIEDYSWYYLSGGVECSIRIADLFFRVRGELYLPIDMNMQSNFNGNYDRTEFKLGVKLGYGIEGMIYYTIYKNEALAVSVFISPYFQQWNIGKSGNVTLTQQGINSGYEAYEPDSSTNIFGYRFGVCVTL